LSEPPIEHRSDETGVTSSVTYLRSLGVPPLPARTEPFDPGYDSVTLAAHLEQSAHLIEILKLSMSSWLVADQRSTVRKIDAAHTAGVPVVSGGGPFEIAVAMGRLEAYLDLVAELGFDRIEAGRGFVAHSLKPEAVVEMARTRGMQVQFELGGKHTGSFTVSTVDALLEEGRRWVDAGTTQVVIEARESARAVGLFDDAGGFDAEMAARFVDSFGIDVVVFEAPTKVSQFALMSSLGPGVHLCNVRLEELLRVEIFRRGLHADAFDNPKLRPRQIDG